MVWESGMGIEWTICDWLGSTAYWGIFFCSFVIDKKGPMSDWLRCILPSVLVSLILGDWAIAHIMSATYLSLTFVHSWASENASWESYLMYICGCVMCFLQLRDYRGGLQSSIGELVSSFSRKGRDRECMPIVHRVVLQPTTVTILKDILSMADDSWSYEEYLVSV